MPRLSNETLHPSVVGPGAAIEPKRAKVEIGFITRQFFPSRERLDDLSGGAKVQARLTCAPGEKELSKRMH
jgi:hypothetical protein